MSEDKKDKEAGTDPSKYAWVRKTAIPPVEEESTGSRFARGCLIATGIAVFAFFLIVGACFIAWS